VSDELVDRARVSELLDALDISGPVSSDMLDHPGRAYAVLSHAQRARGVRNRAAFAIARWRSSRPRPPAPPAADSEPVSEPPSLVALEHAWSLEPSPVGAAILRLMALALEKHGGFGPLQEQIRRR